MRRMFEHALPSSFARVPRVGFQDAFGTAAGFSSCVFCFSTSLLKTLFTVSASVLRESHTTGQEKRPKKDAESSSTSSISSIFVFCSRKRTMCGCHWLVFTGVFCAPLIIPPLCSGGSKRAQSRRQGHASYQSIDQLRDDDT
jgi:hypothetical protein